MKIKHHAEAAFFLCAAFFTLIPAFAAVPASPDGSDRQPFFAVYNLFITHESQLFMRLQEPLLVNPDDERVRETQR